MKITDLRLLVVGNPWKNWLFLILETDSGLSGLGEATYGLSTQPVFGALQELKPALIGENPIEIPLLWKKMLQKWNQPSDVIHLTAMTGIEIACWDILGKHLDAPLYKVLGGAARKEVPVYANGWYRVNRTPDDFAKKAEEVVNRGYHALKFDPFGSAYGTLGRQEETLSLEIVRAVRSSVGDQIQIMIEGHDRFDVSTAIRVGRRLDEFDITFFEAPVVGDDIHALGKVAQEIDVDVAAGERFSQTKQFARLAETGAIHVWQPETLGIGGVWGIQQVAALGLVYDARVYPHNARGPVCTVLNYHLSKWLPNLGMLEMMVEDAVEIAMEIVPNYPIVTDGFLTTALEKPGLGIEIDETAAANYPYNDSNFLNFYQQNWERRFL